MLDWEHDLPSKHIELADEHCRQADFSLALGTSLRIEPANQLPLHAVKNGGQFCFVNLQETKMVRGLHCRRDYVILGQTRNNVDTSESR